MNRFCEKGKEKEKRKELESMKKKLGILFITAVMVMCSIAACSTKETAEEPVEQGGEASTEIPKEEAKKDVTLTFMTSVGWAPDAEIELMEKFTEETGIKIDHQAIPNDQYFNLLTSRINAGECTDLFGMMGGRFDIVSQIDVEKNAVPLSDEEWASRMEDTAKAELSANGVLYGQTSYDASAVWAVAYNKQIFADLQLEIPTTFDEFKAVCDTILQSGITPIYESGADGWHHVLWFPEVGGTYEKAELGLADKLNTNQIKFADSEVMKKALYQIKEMHDLGYWGNDFMANSFDDAAVNFASGEYAMVVVQQGFPNMVASEVPDFPADNIGYFVMPIVDHQLLNVSPAQPSRMIYSGSEHVEEAKQYLEFIARPENLQYIIDNTPDFNTLPFEGVNPKYTEEIKSFYERYPEKAIVFQTQIKYLNTQWMDMGKEIAAICHGASTPEQMLQNIDKGREDQAKAAKDSDWE